MSRKRPDLLSALPPLFPEHIIDAKTGELIEETQYHNTLTKLTNFVREQSELLWLEHKDSLEEELEKITATSPAEVGRQVGLVAELGKLPEDVKAKSRIERLIRYQTITSAKSYFNSDVETKEEPSFSPYLNLGAVDAQMGKIIINDNRIELSFKCWDREFLLFFKIPNYVLSRNLVKITLPIIKPFGNDWGFIFTAEEKSNTPVINDKYVMGVDLGRIEPYTLAVVNSKTGRMVAQYTASNQLRILVDKKNRLNQELGYLYNKSETYEKLKLPVKELLEKERVLTRVKRNRLTNKISWLIATEIDRVAQKFSPRYVALENLAWVNAQHGSSGWSHSKDQTAITHKLTRNGIPTKKVNPKNTSQNCHKCGNKITHHPGKRLIVCTNCTITIDRDTNAAINIAHRPLPKRSQGNNCTVITEVIVSNHSGKRLLTRNTS